MNRRSFVTRALAITAGAAAAPLPGFAAIQEKHDVRDPDQHAIAKRVFIQSVELVDFFDFVGHR